MPSIDSHLQPRHYLKGFLAAKDNPRHADSLFVYKKGMPFRTEGTQSEKNPVLKGLDNVAFVANFYSFLRKDGTDDPQTYETRLEREIERPGNRVLNKLRGVALAADQLLSIREFLNVDEQIAFARYVCGMLGRTKRAREIHDNTVHTTAAETERTGFSFADAVKTAPPVEKGRFLASLRAADPSFDERTGRFGLSPQYLVDFTEERIKGEDYPKGIFAIADWLSPLILAMKWQIRLLPAAHLLPTGDHPVYWTNLREADACLLFPIAAHILFCAGWQSETQEMICAAEDPELIAAAVSSSLASVCQELYYPQQDEKLVNLLNAE